MKTQCINLLKVIAVGIALSFAGVAHGLTPDGETPSTESVCDGLTKKEGWGLCNAYCEAMACHLANDGDDTTAPKASAAACQKVYDNFLQKTGNVIACEDRDRDGVSNTVDNCPNVPNPDQLDYDKDGVGNVCDNCPKTASATQIDSDGDGLGDVCDNCPKKVNSEQLDGDADGFGDVCDNCPLVANKYQKDINTNGIGDACDCGDGMRNSTEACDPPGSTLIDGTTVTVCGPNCQYDKPIVCLTGDTCPCGATDQKSLTRTANELATYAGIESPEFLGCAQSGLNVKIWSDSSTKDQNRLIAFGSNIFKAFMDTCGWVLVNVTIDKLKLDRFSEANELTCTVVNTGTNDNATYCYKDIMTTDASSCIVCETPKCGNGITESGEKCDDGNTISGDGCSDTCQIELQPVCACLDPVELSKAAQACFGSDFYTIVTPDICGGNSLVLDFKSDNGEKRFSAQIFDDGTCVLGIKGSYQCEADVFPTGTFGLNGEEVRACQSLIKSTCDANPATY